MKLAKCSNRWWKLVCDVIEIIDWKWKWRNRRNFNENFIRIEIIWFFQKFKIFLLKICWGEAFLKNLFYQKIQLISTRVWLTIQSSLILKLSNNPSFSWHSQKLSMLPHIVFLLPNSLSLLPQYILNIHIITYWLTYSAKISIFMKQKNWEGGKEYFPIMSA